MPAIRIFGNFFLSLISKFTTGQYNVFDINNGFVALHKSVYENLNLRNIDDGYFFETSMVAEMRNIKCKILDIKIDTIYKNEKNNLVINKILFNFILKHFSILIKRIFNEYIKTKKLLYDFFNFWDICDINLFNSFIKKIIILTILIFLFLLKDKKQLYY